MCAYTLHGRHFLRANFRRTIFSALPHLYVRNISQKLSIPHQNGFFEHSTSAHLICSKWSYLGRIHTILQVLQTDSHSQPTKVITSPRLFLICTKKFTQSLGLQSPARRTSPDGQNKGCFYLTPRSPCAKV